MFNWIGVIVQEKLICDWPKNAKCKPTAPATTPRPLKETAKPDKKPVKPSKEPEHIHHDTLIPSKPVHSEPSSEVGNKPALINCKHILINNKQVNKPIVVNYRREKQSNGIISFYILCILFFNFSPIQTGVLLYKLVMVPSWTRQIHSRRHRSHTLYPHRVWIRCSE